MTPTVYLAGPIRGYTEAEAKSWRHDTARRLRDLGIRVLDPLRSEPKALSEVYGATYDEQLWGHATHIKTKNRFDVLNADIVLAYLPEHPDDPRVISLGTVMEIGWAEQAGKTVFVVAEDEYTRQHPLLPGIVLGDLEDAVTMIADLVGPLT